MFKRRVVPCCRWAFYCPGMFSPVAGGGLLSRFWVVFRRLHAKKTPISIPTPFRPGMNPPYTCPFYFFRESFRHPFPTCLPNFGNGRSCAVYGRAVVERSFAGFVFLCGDVPRTFCKPQKHWSSLVAYIVALSTFKSVNDNAPESICQLLGLVSRIYISIGVWSLL